MCVPLSTRCRIFWIVLDWSTVLLLGEIAAKLCFCTNATISNYFRTHQFGPKEAVWENPSLWWSLLSKLKRFLPRKRHHHLKRKSERTKYCPFKLVSVFLAEGLETEDLFFKHVEYFLPLILLAWTNVFSIS